MALHTLGTNANNSLQTALTWTASLLDGDIGNLDDQISSDIFTAQYASVPDAPNPPGTVGTPQPPGIIGTGTTSVGGATVTAMTYVAGGPLASIQTGMAVMGQGIPAGSFVVGFTGTTLTIGPAGATAAATGVYILIVPQSLDGSFSRQGQLLIPGRGLLKLRVGDVVAVDNTGWPILVSGASVNYQGSVWHLV